MLLSHREGQAILTLNESLSRHRSHVCARLSRAGRPSRGASRAAPRDALPSGWLLPPSLPAPSLSDLFIFSLPF